MKNETDAGRGGGRRKNAHAENHQTGKISGNWILSNERHSIKAKMKQSGRVEEEEVRIDI